MNGIKYYRMLAGLSQRELARRAGITPATIQRFEKIGNSDAGTVRNYLKISDILGVSLDELWREDFPNPLPFGQTQVKRHSRTVHPENCIAIYREEKGLTLETIAKMIGITTKEGGRIACKRKVPLTKHIEMIAKHEGMSAAAFLAMYSPRKEAA